MTDRAPVLAPTLSATFAHLEYSVHPLPRPLRRDLRLIFPDLPAPPPPALLIPTLQRSSVDLQTFGPSQAAEKDRLLARFLVWASAVRAAIARRQPDAWADVTDPASGAAHFGTAAALYSDVEGLVAARQFPTVDCGGCRVARHPQWRFAVYPATMFTTASPETITAALLDVNGPAAPAESTYPLVPGL